jgi:hypothetical protein
VQGKAKKEKGSATKGKNRKRYEDRLPGQLGRDKEKQEQKEAVQRNARTEG